MQQSILITGGAGYIGSHVVKLLGNHPISASQSLIVLDDLSTGFLEAVIFGEVIEGSASDERLVRELLHDYRVGAVMHFAASTIVPESVADPLKYYTNNCLSTLKLLRCCTEANVKHFIFSSTAAVYGNPDSPECTEQTPTRPINPYGMSKLMSEIMLRDASRVHDLTHVILRYFNVAGADPEGLIGQNTRHATHLTKVAVEAAVGKRSYVEIFGTDYPTPDGTGIRDYIHVEDLAMAHLKALEYLRAGGDSITLNCGYGHGFSVREILRTVERLSGRKLDIREAPRRAGDPPALTAGADRIRQVLSWQPRHDHLESIIGTALSWERRLMGMPFPRQAPGRGSCPELLGRASNVNLDG